MKSEFEFYQEIVSGPILLGQLQTLINEFPRVFIGKTWLKNKENNEKKSNFQSLFIKF